MNRITITESQLRETITDRDAIAAFRSVVRNPDKQLGAWWGSYGVRTARGHTNPEGASITFVWTPQAQRDAMAHPFIRRWLPELMGLGWVPYHIGHDEPGFDFGTSLSSRTLRSIGPIVPRKVWPKRVAS